MSFIQEFFNRTVQQNYVAPEERAKVFEQQLDAAVKEMQQQ